MSTALYPELIDFIFNYCGRFMTDKESKASWHQFAMEKSGNGAKEGFHNYFKKRNFISTDPEILILPENGFQSFKEKVATRIYDEHTADELNLNLCPKYFKIARTPRAKQCRFCFYDWH